MRRKRIEGTLEHFTLWDAFNYAGKVLYGPFKPSLPSNFNPDLVPRGPGGKGDAITFVLLGDIMVNKHLLKRNENLYNHLPQALKESDLLFANLEFPIQSKSKTKGFPRFNGSIDYFDGVVAPLRPGCLNIANNHSLDMGPAGLQATTTFLKKRNIPYIGLAAEGQSFQTLKIRGKRVTITGFTHSTNRWRNSSEKRVNYLRLNAWCRKLNGLDRLLAVVDGMKRAGDLVVLSLHWGLEFELNPTSNQVHIAHTLIENGVDLIVGHHPHVLQPLEVWPGADGLPRLVVYSLGNWISNMSNPATRVTAAVKVWLNQTGELLGVETFPFLFDGNTLYPLAKECRYQEYVPLSMRACMSADHI